MANLKTVEPAELGVTMPPRVGRHGPRRFMNHGEPECLLALARSVKPAIMVEVGVNEGLTASMFFNAFGEELKWYIGVDVLPGYMTEKAVQRREVPKDPGIKVVDQDRFTLMLRPRGTLDMTYRDFPSRVDFMFIDGDHGRAGVSHDTAIAANVVTDAGLVVWHDYHHLGTVDVAEVLELVDEGCGAIKHIKGTWLAYSTGADLRAALTSFGGASPVRGKGNAPSSSAVARA